MVSSKTAVFRGMYYEVSVRGETLVIPEAVCGAMYQTSPQDPFFQLAQDDILEQLGDFCVVTPTAFTRKEGWLVNQPGISLRAWTDWKAFDRRQEAEDLAKSLGTVWDRASCSTEGPRASTKSRSREFSPRERGT